MIELYVSEDAPARPTVAGVKRVAGEHPGDHVLRLLVQRRGPGGVATLTFGREWRFDGSVECLEALSEFGEAQLVPVKEKRHGGASGDGKTSDGGR